MPDLRRVIPVIIETGLPLQTEKREDDNSLVPAADSGRATR